MRVGVFFAVVSVLVSATIGWGREPVEAVKPPDLRITPSQLDALVTEELDSKNSFTEIFDEQFLRRLSLDLIGRQPTPSELDTFLAKTSPQKRGLEIDRLMASEEFGKNWANYWSDTISFRVPPPELTFLNYKPLKGWLSERLNQNKPWNTVVADLLTGTGKVKDSPQTTFVAYHQGNPVKLASETARIFLAAQIQCAECHDHPFDDWKREQFHQMAAFFARSSVKMPWNQGAETVVSDKKKGEYHMPNAADPRKKGKKMDPAFLDGTVSTAGKSDLERRRALAAFVANPNNPWFAKAYTNRIWSRLMGRGFYDPVDNISDNQLQLLPKTHAALTVHFQQTGMNVKDLFRLITNSNAYQQSLWIPDVEQAVSPPKPFATAVVAKLRGDEVFDSLVAAIKLPNVTPAQRKATKAIRFPPPPKSTRDLVAEAFGYDPSVSPDEIPRTISQAMLMMNNKQLHAQINAKPDSGTMLSKLLQIEKDDRNAVVKLFKLVLARKPSARESTIATDHIRSVNDRPAAFEDLLWSLINTTEFTSKR